MVTRPPGDKHTTLASARFAKSGHVCARTRGVPNAMFGTMAFRAPRQCIVMWILRNTNVCRQLRLRTNIAFASHAPLHSCCPQYWRWCCDANNAFMLQVLTAAYLGRCHRIDQQFPLNRLDKSTFTATKRQQHSRVRLAEQSEAR